MIQFQFRCYRLWNMHLFYFLVYRWCTSRSLESEKNDGCWRCVKCTIYHRYCLVVKAGLLAGYIFATLISAIVGQFSQPSSSRIFKRYVKEEQVANAIAFNQTLQSLFMIFGPVVGSLVYTQLGLFTSLYSLIILFLLSAIALSFYRNGLNKSKWQEIH